MDERRYEGMDMRDKIMGSLLGAALGDTIGSVTEARTTQAIVQRHGGYVRELRKAPPDTFSRMNWRGAVTDDFSLVYVIGSEYIKSKGNASQKMFENALIAWSNLPQYFLQAGPTSKDRIWRLKGEPYDKSRDHLIARHDVYTNGTAMKASPVGLVNPGNFDRVIEETILMCLPTHPASLAISGGTAVACAVAEAMTDKATKESIIDAALYGAEKGIEQSRKSTMPISGAKIGRRIEMAVEIAVKYGNDYEKLLNEMASVVGTGFSNAESPAAAFGLFLAAKDPMELIYMATNVGGDTDTLATIGASVYGAYTGASAFDPGAQKLIEDNNYCDSENTVHMDLGWLADGLAAIAEERSERS